MRMSAILATAFIGLGITAAGAQQSTAPQTQPQPQPPASSSQGAQVRSLNIVDISQLPPDTQTEVNKLVAKTTQADFQNMRGAIDRVPQIKAALQQKGLTSAEVVVASLSNDGVLTLITKKKAG
jgi:hypothetical protein